MKRNSLFTLLLLFSLILAACGNTNDSNNAEDILETPAVDMENEDTVEKDESKEDEAADVTDEGEVTEEMDASDNEDMSKKMDEIDYQEFELDVEYANDDEFEVELEHKSNGTVKAKIEDGVNNLEKYDESAFNDLYPIVSQLSITQETTKEEAIQEVLTAFSLNDNYKDFELEIKFKDGTKIEFEDEQ